MSRTFLLQDWVTIRGTNGGAQPTPFTQDEERWLDLTGYSDAACWIDVMEVTPPAANNWVTLALETSAVCDDTYFTPTATAYFGAAPFNVPSTTPVVVRSTRSVSASALMRYLRWKITPSTTGLWDLTFRIRAVATRSSAFVPTDIGGCLLWLRGDLGISFSGGAVNTWADQSGSGHDASTSGTSPGYGPAAVNGLPAIQGNGMNQAMKTVAFDAGSNASFFTVVQPTVANEGNTARIFEQNNTSSYYLGSTTAGTAYKLIVDFNTPPFGTAETGSVQQAPSIVSATYAGGSPGVGTIYYNGASPIGDSTHFNSPTGGSLQMFLMSSYFATNFWTGYLAEVIVYNTVLSASNLRRVHRYLGARYNIAVP